MSNKKEENIDEHLVVSAALFMRPKHQASHRQKEKHRMVCPVNFIIKKKFTHNYQVYNMIII